MARNNLNIFMKNILLISWHSLLSMYSEIFLEDSKKVNEKYCIFVILKILWNLPS